MNNCWLYNFIEQTAFRNVDEMVTEQVHFNSLLDKVNSEFQKGSSLKQGNHLCKHNDIQAMMKRKNPKTSKKFRRQGSRGAANLLIKRSGTQGSSPYARKKTSDMNLHIVPESIETGQKRRVSVNR